jgi:dihydroorotate dehydrogenase
VFRIPSREALINRLGFNNDGIERFVANLARSRTWRSGRRGSSSALAAAPVLGLNIGKNAVTPIERAVDDYVTCLRHAMPVADYVTINISSPNTRQLRELQASRELDPLLRALDRERARLISAGARDTPLLVKIAPDLDDEQIEAVCGLLKRYAVDGVIATNTTLGRTGVAGLPNAEEAGGLSGRPLFEASNRVIRLLRASLAPRFPIIGAGGVMSAADAVAKVACGADLVQLYTGLIYGGPALVGDCAAALRASSRTAAR